MLSIRTSSDSFFFFNDTATTEIYTLSLHDALPISGGGLAVDEGREAHPRGCLGEQHRDQLARGDLHPRSEEHTSELQSQSNLVCRLLLEKKKQTYTSRRARTACIYTMRA